METNIDNFKEGLREFIRRNDFSQQDVADILGCSAANVNKMLNASNKVTYESIVKLLMAGMRLEEAFGENVATIIRAGEQNSVVDGDRLSPAQIVRIGLEELLKNDPNTLESLIRSIK